MKVVFTVWLTFAWFAAHSVCAAPVDAAQRQELSGPLVGAVTENSANIWAYVPTNQDPNLAVRYWKVSDPAKVTEVKMTASAETNWAAKATLANLEPLTAYAFRILPETLQNAEGQFVTAPRPLERGKFRMAFSSCMKAGEYPDDPKVLVDTDQTSWARMLAQKPAFHFLLGDNVYADSLNHEVIWKAHLTQRSAKHFAALIRQVPTFAIWDDHDFATDDSSGGPLSDAEKAGTLRAFTELFANPSYGLKDVPGVFFNFTWGDVEFFGLDVRYYRSPNNMEPSAQKTILGDKQFEWLLARLKDSKARFKVIASGSGWGPQTPLPVKCPEKEARDDWSSFAHSQAKLMETIRGVPGVLMISGDVHRCETRRHFEFPDLHPYDDTTTSATNYYAHHRIFPYPLYEVVSSGIAKYKRQHEPNQWDRYGGFATMDFDTSTAGDEQVLVRIIRRDGIEIEQRRIFLNELHFVDWPNPKP